MVRDKRDNVYYPTKGSEELTIYEIHTDLDIEGYEDMGEDGEPSGLKLPYVVTILEENGELISDLLPIGSQIIVRESDVINAGDPLTSDPNVGGFGQLDTEVVLQSPIRIIGLIAFFLGVGLTQILLVLKKKQVEKVQAAEGI